MRVSLPYAGEAPGNITHVDQPDFLAILVVRRALEGSTRLDGYIAVLKLRSARTLGSVWLSICYRYLQCIVPKLRYLFSYREHSVKATKVIMRGV
jgi:hypothetical protein